jgi:hypothetical protein
VLEAYGNLHFKVLSMNKLSQTEPATFIILPCWAFFRDSVFLYFSVKAYIFSSLFIVNYPASLQNVDDYYAAYGLIPD